jgi:hypothetical protein
MYSHYALRQPAPALHRTAADGSPFIPITWRWRIAVLGYVIVYNVIAPGVGQVLSDIPAPLAVPRLWAEVIYQTLLFMPLLFYRPDYGWLHPLIFPVLFDTAIQLTREPIQLIAPFMGVGPGLGVASGSAALVGFDEMDLAVARLTYTSVKILAITVYYIGYFFGPKIRVPEFLPCNPSNVRLKSLAAVLVAAAVFLMYVHSRGGLSAHLLSLRYLRFETLGGDGPILVLIAVAGIAILVWYALDERAGRRPLFWAAAAFGIPVGFLSGGSRSAVVYELVLLAILWALRHQRMPASRGLVLAAVSFLIFGALGIIRTDYEAREVNWGTLTSLDMAAWAEAADQEVAQRAANDSGLVVVALGPEAGLLWGKTYLSAVLFWFPRAWWHGKPRGAGAYTAAVLFEGQDLASLAKEPPRSAALPPGAVAEAFWNFHVPGVVVIFFLYGMFHRWLARLLLINARAAAVWPLYAILLLHFLPQTDSMIETLQAAIPCFALLYWMNAFKYRRSRLPVT